MGKSNIQVKIIRIARSGLQQFRWSLIELNTVLKTGKSRTKTKAKEDAAEAKRGMIPIATFLANERKRTNPKGTRLTYDQTQMQQAIR